MLEIDEEVAYLLILGVVVQEEHVFCEVVNCGDGGWGGGRGRKVCQKLGFCDDITKVGRGGGEETWRGQDGCCIHDMFLEK